MNDQYPAMSAAPLSLNGAAQFLSPDDLADTIVGFRGRDQRSRAFNLLRSQVMRFTQQGARLIGLTSPTPQVGKTFIACNLAASMARLPDQQTYLFDCDLRRGSVGERFGIPQTFGLADYLTGDVDDLGGMAWKIEGEELTIFPTFEKEMNSSELLAGPRFTAMIGAMRATPKTAVHLCDLPPVFANDDAMIACKQLDGYLLVVEDGVTTGKQLKDAMRLLGPEKCMGTVLNRYIQGLAPGDYGFGYGKQGSYASYYG